MSGYPWLPVIEVRKPIGSLPGSCNCACKSDPVLVVAAGSTQCTQATRLCLAHATDLAEKLAAFLADLKPQAFRRRGPRIGGRA